MIIWTETVPGTRWSATIHNLTLTISNSHLGTFFWVGADGRDPRWAAYFPSGSWTIGDALSVSWESYDTVVFAPPQPAPSRPRPSALATTRRPGRSRRRASASGEARGRPFTRTRCP